MKLLLQLSFRNLFRHKRRNAMLLLAIAVAVGGVNASNTLLRGFQMDMLNTAVASLTGHVKVHAQGYRDDPSISRGFTINDDYAPDVPAEALLGWAPRVRLPAVIMSERETRGVQIVGVDPAAEGISFLADAGIDGEFLKDEADGRIVIGRDLARQLETSVGRRLVIITQGADGRNRERGYRVAGTFDAEGVGLEKIYAFVGIEALQKILQSDAVTEVSIRLTDERFRPAAKASMESSFATMDVLDWQDLEPALAQMFIFADAALLIWFLLMMGALTFGLVNSLVAAVMERVKELGMMRALGMRRRTVILQVVIESVIMMAVGVIAGTLLALGIYFWLADGIDLSVWAEGIEMAGMSTLLVPVLLPADMILVAFMSLVLGFLASLYPAWRVVKLSPLEALHK